MNDEALLADIPEQFAFNALLKATPASEGDGRFIYVEASKESRDQQGEIVLAKALKDSAHIFMKFGVVDMDHKSMPSVARQYGIEHPDEWIIGQPREVRFDGGTTFVKAQLRQGDSKLAERANRVWEGLTQVNPPDRYYASVGGSVLEKSIEVDPETGARTPVITKTRWDNLALSLSPVHPDLTPAHTLPVGTFTKSLGGFVIAKTLTAGYGTDSAALEGGAALRMQSLYGAPISNYDTFKTAISNALKSRDTTISVNEHPLKTRLIDWAESTGIDGNQAVSWVHRFLFDAAKDLKTKR